MRKKQLIQAVLVGAALTFGMQLAGADTTIAGEGVRTLKLDDGAVVQARSADQASFAELQKGTFCSVSEADAPAVIKAAEMMGCWKNDNILWERDQHGGDIYYKIPWEGCSGYVDPIKWCEYLEQNGTTLKKYFNLKDHAGKDIRWNEFRSGMCNQEFYPYLEMKAK